MLNFLIKTGKGTLDNSMPPVSHCEKPKKYASTGNPNANNVCVCRVDNT